MKDGSAGWKCYTLAPIHHRRDMAGVTELDLISSRGDPCAARDSFLLPKDLWDPR